MSRGKELLIRTEVDRVGFQLLMHEFLLRVFLFHSRMFPRCHVALLDQIKYPLYDRRIAHRNDKTRSDHNGLENVDVEYPQSCDEWQTEPLFGFDSLHMDRRAENIIPNSGNSFSSRQAAKGAKARYENKTLHTNMV
jgi:hypothetical protein